MEWVEKYLSLSPREKEEFTRIVNHLLSCTFICKRNENTRRAFYFVERHEAIFQGYLSLAGWDLIVDRVHGVCQALSRLGTNRLNLNLIQSILLLILRLLYEEKRRELSIVQDILARTEEVQEKCLALKIQTRPLDKKTLRETFALFKKFQLVEILDEDITDPECRFLIYPTVLMAVRVETIQELYNRLTAYTAGEEGEENNNEDPAED